MATAKKLAIAYIVSVTISLLVVGFIFSPIETLVVAVAIGLIAAVAVLAAQD